jgi:predicted lipoprotein with Yx(FWY)xxD motif
VISPSAAATSSTSGTAPPFFRRHSTLAACLVDLNHSSSDGVVSFGALICRPRPELWIGTPAKSKFSVEAQTANQGTVMNKQLRVRLSALAVAVALAGCGGSPGATSPTTGTPPTSATAPAPGVSTTPAADVELKTATSAAGQIVVDKEGKSVYFFTKDVKDSGTSACKDVCATAWPAVPTTSNSPAVEGVSGTIGTISTAGGSKQITINGMPVYYFAKDNKAGDILGQGVNNSWYLVSPAGEMLKSVGGAY